MMPLQIEVFIKCMSPLVGLFKSVCQSPDFHFTKPAFGLPIVCLSLHAFITWFSASRKLLIAFVLIGGNCSSYCSIVVSIQTSILSKERLKNLLVILIIHPQHYKWKSKWSLGCQGSDVACQINKGRAKEKRVCEWVMKKVHVHKHEPFVCRSACVRMSIACECAHPWNRSLSTNACMFIYMSKRRRTRLDRCYFWLYDYLLEA